MSTALRSSEVVTGLRLTNSRSATIRFYLEPWGEEYPMPPGATFEAVARGPDGGTLELDLAEDGVAVWGWAGSVVAVSHNGATLGADARTPVPIDSGRPEQQAAAAGARSGRARAT